MAVAPWGMVSPAIAAAGSISSALASSVPRKDAARSAPTARLPRAVASSRARFTTTTVSSPSAGTPLACTSMPALSFVASVAAASPNWRASSALSGE